MSKKEKKILRSFMMITQISITMLVPIFISGWLGTWLNRLFGTQIIFPFMLLLGIGAAFKNVYILTKSFYEADMKKEHEQLDYMKGLTEKREEAAGEHETGKTGHSTYEGCKNETAVPQKPDYYHHTGCNDCCGRISQLCRKTRSCRSRQYL